MATACATDEEKKVDQELCKALTEGVNLRKEVHYSSDRSLHKRSLVLDEENFEKTFLKCSVCRESFRSLLKIPKLLPCHHSFCLPCIKVLYQAEVKYRQSVSVTLRSVTPSAVSIHCPTCRGNFITTEDNLRSLPTDHRIIQLLDFVKHTDRYTVSFCSKHKLQPLNFFCEPCIQPVCRDCTVLEHKEQDGHLVMDLNEALEKYSPILDEAIAEMESELTVLEKKHETLDNATKRLEEARSDLLNSIHETFGRLKEQIAERERELESIAENEVNKEKKLLDEKVEIVSSRMNALKENCSTLKQAKAESSIEDMFNCHQKVREYKAKPLVRIREVDDGFMTTYSFNARDEGFISSRISNFGDINSKIESTFKTTTTTTTNNTVTNPPATRNTFN